MDHLQTFQVFPAIPEPLSFLKTLSRNLWWSWQRDAVELFRRVDPRLWEETGRNPLAFSTSISQDRLEELSKDNSFLAHQQRVMERFEKRVSLPVEYSRTPYGEQGLISYFSMEFGVHESVPLFAGGLGILAGDHLKAASNLAVPLVGIGLLYRQGYFRQFLNQDGWQQEEYPETDLYHLPVERALDTSGNEVRISIPGPAGEIRAMVWKLLIGRIHLYLLDTNLSDNPPEIRDITLRLYAGESKIRLAQEVLLGIGGMQALNAMGIVPTVCHINEGHAAFSTLERASQVMSLYNVDLKTALEIVPRTTVFTTHTPVAAGHDEFPVELVKPYLVPFEEKLGTTVEEILSWGQPVGAGPNGPISMFVLALRMAQYCNGVSQLHGKVARRMWSHVWPERPEDEVPITHVTNGIHLTSWISPEISQLFEQYLGPDWHLPPRNPDIIRRIDEIYDEELWRAHEMSHARLVRTCRELMIRQYSRRNAPRSMMRDVESVLDQDALTIAFARRFTAYKRAYLLFLDPDRLETIINSEKYPVQFILSGKAHPKDNEGKELIKRTIEFARQKSVRHRIVFLEDYDPHIARHLVQGADVWLNTPRRPFEACGTSGMKAAANGVINVSTLDGWWCEGYSEEQGWSVGSGEDYADHAYQDAVESQALYNVLENEVIPCFYERKNGDIPTRWIKMMKASMKMAIGQFSSHRMMKEYESRFYIQAHNQFQDLVKNDAEKARRLVYQRERLLNLWSSIRIDTPVRHTSGSFRVGQTVTVTAVVHLGQILPDEVDVELYYGRLKSVDSISASQTQQMTVQGDMGNGEYLYSCTITCDAAGRYGFTARVSPRGDDWIKFTPGFLTWA